MSTDPVSSKQVTPLVGWEERTEDYVIGALDQVVADAKLAARLSVIAIGNYVATHENWPRAIDRANTLMNELDDTESRYW